MAHKGHHFSRGWELVADEKTSEKEEATGTKKKFKNKKWKVLSLAGYVEPVCDFENHPFTKQMQKEGEELTMKERERAVEAREKTNMQWERQLSIREEVCNKFERMQFGIGRGAAKEKRNAFFEEVLASGKTQFEVPKKIRPSSSYFCPTCSPNLVHNK